MKSFLLILLFLGGSSVGFCQTKAIVVGTGVTTTLVFESEVRHVDLGSRSLLAQQTKEAPQVVLIKAAQKDFPATNVSVVTADGQVYSLLVEYDSSPRQWVYRVAAQGKQPIKAYAESILGNGGRVKASRNAASAMAAVIKGIYIKEGTLFFHLILDNDSQIPLDIDAIRFSIRDKKKARRTASQETELTPSILVGGLSTVPSRGKTEIVAAFDKFTLPDEKYLHIEISEKGGGRHLSIRLKNRNILLAKVLTDL